MPAIDWICPGKVCKAFQKTKFYNGVYMQAHPSHMIQKCYSKQEGVKCKIVSVLVESPLKTAIFVPTLTKLTSTLNLGIHVFDVHVSDDHVTGLYI